jgi:hypothetical protein
MTESEVRKLRKDVHDAVGSSVCEGVLLLLTRTELPASTPTLIHRLSYEVGSQGDAQWDG